MHMVISIHAFQCCEGPPGQPADAKCWHEERRPHAGHCSIYVRNASLPWYMSRPAWAELYAEMPPPKGATETLRWAVSTLAEQLAGTPRPVVRAGELTVLNDDDWDNIPAYEQPF